MEQLKKVVRLDENLMGNEEDDGVQNENEVSDMDKLPSEILMKILDYLNEQQLVKCRILSSRWNEICCLLLQNKSKNNPRSKLKLRIGKVRDKKTYDFKLECSTVITKPLKDFLDCFFPPGIDNSSRVPRPFPFSCFHLGGLVCMTYKELTKLALTFRHVKSVFFYVCLQDVEAIGTVWRLLLKFAPNIEHLGFDGDYNLNRLNLFEPYFNFNANTNPEDETQNQNYSFLKNLKVLEITSGWLQHLEGFLLSIFKYTPNLQQLIIHNENLRSEPTAKESVPYEVLIPLHKSGLDGKVSVKYGV